MAEPVGEWLAARAESYGQDAAKLRYLPDVAGLSGEQWAIVYTTIRDELRKCAAEVAS